MPVSLLFFGEDNAIVCRQLYGFSTLPSLSCVLSIGQRLDLYRIYARNCESQTPGQLGRLSHQEAAVFGL